MSLTDIASIVSSGAVALTLIFLAMQVRQTEKNQRAIIQQGRADRIGDQVLQIAAQPALSVIFSKGMQQPEALSREEFDQFILLTRAILISSEDSFIQHKVGTLDRASYDSYVAGARNMLGAWPGLRAAWRLTSAQYAADYAAFMDDLVDQATKTPMPDRFAHWTALVQAQKLPLAAAASKDGANGLGRAAQ